MKSTKTVPLAAVLVVGLAALSTGCMERFAGTDVFINLKPRLKVSEAGEHYEVFVTLHGAPLLLKKFYVRTVEACRCNAPPIWPEECPPEALQCVDENQALDFYSGEKIGLVNAAAGFNPLPQEGVNFLVDANLEDATEGFIVIKSDQHVSDAPTAGTVIAGGKFYASARGVLRAFLYTPGAEENEANLWAEMALVVAKDMATGF